MYHNVSVGVYTHTHIYIWNPLQGFKSWTTHIQRYIHMHACMHAYKRTYIYGYTYSSCIISIINDTYIYMLYVCIYAHMSSNCTYDVVSDEIQSRPSGQEAPHFDHEKDHLEGLTRRLWSWETFCASERWSWSSYAQVKEFGGFLSNPWHQSWNGIQCSRGPSSFWECAN
jgi:hypothetical protein